MNLSIAILEDQKHDYEQLANHLNKWAYEQGHVIRIYWFDNMTGLLSSSEVPNCHILFSDIELKNAAEGITACTSLRNRGYTGEIIFLTAFKEYVFQGYDVQAFNYLLKPIQESVLYKCMERYISLHCANYYYFHKEDKIIQIPYNNIVSISRAGHDCNIQTTDDIFVERIALKEFETRLPAQFLRCHKCCIVNTLHIKSLSGSILKLSNNQCQTVGRTYLDSIRKALIKLVNESLNI